MVINLDSIDAHPFRLVGLITRQLQAQGAEPKVIKLVRTLAALGRQDVLLIIAQDWCGATIKGANQRRRASS